MNQSPYRLRSSSAGPRSAENERLAQAVKLDRYKELMPGTEERDSTHVVVSGEIADTIESPWGLSSSPHFDTIHKQTTTSHSRLTTHSSSLPVSPSLSKAYEICYKTHTTLPTSPSTCCYTKWEIQTQIFCRYGRKRKQTAFCNRL